SESRPRPGRIPDLVARTTAATTPSGRKGVGKLFRCPTPGRYGRRLHTPTAGSNSAAECTGAEGSSDGEYCMSKFFYILTIISMVIGGCVAGFMFLTAVLVCAGIGVVRDML